jgi:hypothetical protein
MAKKNTYAAVMKQLSNKKAQYEKGLEDARRTQNRSGVVDYERRLTKLAAGMDELFQAQESSKAPQGGAQFAGGGMTKNEAMYKLGGTYSENMPPQVDGGIKRFRGLDGFADGGFTLPNPDSGDYWNQIQAMKDRYTKAFIAAKEGGVSGEDKAFLQWFRDNAKVLQAGDEATARTAQSAIQAAAPAPAAPFDPSTLGETNMPIEGAAKVAPSTRIGLYKGQSQVPWDGRPNALVTDNGMMVVGTAEDGTRFVHTPNSMSLKTNHPKLYSKFLRNEGGTGAGQFEFDPSTYSMGSFGPNGKFVPAGEQPTVGSDGRAISQEEMAMWQNSTANTQPDLLAYMDDLPTVQQTPENPQGRAIVEDSRVVDRYTGNQIYDPVVVSGTSTPLGATATDPSIGGGGVRAQGTAPTTPRSTAATSSATGTTATAPESEVIPNLAGRSASQVLNTAKGDMYYPGGAPLGLEGDVTGGVGVDPTIPTKSHGLGDLKNRAANTFGNLKNALGSNGSNIGGSTLGMVAGAAAQFVPDLIAKGRMKDIQGPIDTPQMRLAMGNTNIDTSRALSAIQNQTAAANAAVERNFANPAVAAAMMRANMNAAQQNLGGVLANEASQELQLRNQNLQRAADVSNQNLMIDAQNRQAQAGFSNDRLAAMNRMDMQMGQKLGGLYTDFQNRAQDRAKWDMYSKIFNEDMLKRQGIDPTS